LDNKKLKEKEKEIKELNSKLEMLQESSFSIQKEKHNEKIEFESLLELEKQDNLQCHEELDSIKNLYEDLKKN